MRNSATLTTRRALTHSGDAPMGDALVAQARQRLASELAALPQWGDAALLPRLHARDTQPTVSFGALTSFLRCAMRAGDLPAARDLFVLLLERTEGMNRLWAQRSVARTPAVRGARGETVREELRQELTLRLWEQLALGASEKWELFFQRSLEYAQRHTATLYMEQRGYWIAPNAQPSATAASGPRRVTSLTRLLERESGWPSSEANPLLDLTDLRDSLSAAELSDLRALVLRLPPRQRMVIVMRFWQSATEAEMAQALGVTTRSVRNYQTRALHYLRVWYTGYTGTSE